MCSFGLIILLLEEENIHSIDFVIRNREMKLLLPLQVVGKSPFFGIGSKIRRLAFGFNSKCVFVDGDTDTVVITHNHFVILMVNEV